MSPSFEGAKPEVASLLGGFAEAMAAGGFSRPPSEIARDPESTPQELLDATRYFPEDVLDNPALPLLALAEPAFWRAITHAARRQIVRLEAGLMKGRLPAELWRIVDAFAVLRAAPALLELLEPTPAGDQACAAIAYLTRWGDGEPPELEQLDELCQPLFSDEPTYIARWHAADVLTRGVRGCSNTWHVPHERILPPLVWVAACIATVRGGDSEEVQLCEEEAQLRDMRWVLEQASR